MRKTLLGPGAGDVETEELTHATHSVGVATDHADHTRVVLSGMASPEDGLQAQTRDVLDFAERVLADVGGSLDDVVRMRWHVEAETLDRDAQGAIHEVRDEFFEAPHYPASTMVGVASILGEGSLFELEMEAEIPDDEWQTNALVGEAREEISGGDAQEMLEREP